MASQASKDKRTAKGRKFLYLFNKLFHLEIGEIAGVAEVTVKQTYKLMLPRAAEIFPADFKFDTSIDQLPTS